MAPSIHDNFLLGYEVNAVARTITLKTEFRSHEGAERTDVIFSDVEAYGFEGDPFGTILFEVSESDVFKALEENWRVVQNGRPWASSLAQAQAHLAETKCRAFAIESSVGMSGWVFARAVEMVAR